MRTLFLRELKLIIRNRITLFYFMLSIGSFFFLSFSFLSKPENNSRFEPSLLLFLLSNLAFIGVSSYCWSWESNYFKLFLLKNKLRKVILVKIFTSYIIQFFGVLVLISSLYFTGYNNYLKLVLCAGINSLGFFTLFFLYLLSFKIKPVDLYDANALVVKQSVMNFIILFLILLQVAIYHFVLPEFDFTKIILISIAVNILLLLLLFNSTINGIERRIEKNIKL